mgnify:CR=1 FL=1
MFGVDGYKVPYLSHGVRGVAFNRDMETSFIETEARYRKAFPGVGQYNTYVEKDWKE